MEPKPSYIIDLGYKLAILVATTIYMNTYTRNQLMEFVCNSIQSGTVNLIPYPAAQQTALG